MRWLILTFLLILGTTGSTLSAQGEVVQPGAGGSVFNDTMMVRIAQRLQLTDDQLPVVEGLLADYQNDLTNNPPASPEDRRARKRALRARILGVLTPEQKARAKARRGGGKKNAPAQQKRHWLDVIMDDVAKPLLDRRRQRGQGG